MHRLVRLLPALILLALGLFLPALACRPSPKSHRSYDQIREIVTGKTGAEVEKLLGPPDLRQTVLDDQRWIWWSYTFLDGVQYAPEVRGQIVHLEITLQSPSGSANGPWRVAGPLAVSYSIPSPKH